AFTRISRPCAEKTEGPPPAFQKQPSRASNRVFPGAAGIFAGSLPASEPLKKKREKASKAHSERKHKKEAKVAGDEAKPIAQLKPKDKKGNHKSKENKKKKKDS